MRNFTRKICNSMGADAKAVIDREMAMSGQPNITNGSGDLHIRAKYIADEDRVELLILGEIGQSWWGESVSAKEVNMFLADHRGKDVLAKVDTPGGDCYDGMAIMNGMLDHDGHIKARIMGLCYSAGSFVVLGCDEIEAHETSTYGIHPAWMVCGGNQYQLEDKKLWLDSIDRMIMNVYQRKTGMSSEAIKDLFVGPAKDGTVFTATEALAHGFIDSLITMEDRGQRESDDDTEPEEVPADSGSGIVVAAADDPAIQNKAAAEILLRQLGNKQNRQYVENMLRP